MKRILLFTFLIIGFITKAQLPSDFVFEISSTGPIEFQVTSNNNVTVDWGDGTTTNLSAGTNQFAGHSYSWSSSNRTIIVSGSMDSLRFLYFASDLTVLQWGNSQWKTMEYMFHYVISLSINTTDTPDLSQCVSMKGTFKTAPGFNDDISNWDVSNVTDMSEMFYGTSFNQSLSNWDVSNVNNMSYMFYNAYLFNQPLDNWDVSNVTIMNSMFYDARSFNQNINNWDVSNVNNMGGMFTGASDYNQPMNNWDVSNVTELYEMFRYATSFNQDINDWDTSSVTSLAGMFSLADSFNQPLNNWDVSNVLSMQRMFYRANSFNQDLSSWNFNQMVTFEYFTPGEGYFASFSGLDTVNYDKLLQRFVYLGLQSNSMQGIGLTYCDTSSRNTLIQNGWTFVYDSLDPNCPASHLQGNITFDANNNGCSTNDLPGANNGLNISNGNSTIFIYADNNGSYSTSLSDGTYTVTPILDANLFTSAPISATITAANQNTSTQDFCLTANTPTDDLEITIMPLQEARPGFDTDYKLIYKNKGNTQLTGTIAFTYDDDYMDFLSANPTVTSSSVGILNWSFSNIDPFETREIEFKLNMNTPTAANFPLNSNDILSFNASISPSSNDATPLDNIINLDQTVVNSYDPNDKTCLQGETIDPSIVGEYIHYRIRFENEGTASAINVNIVDYLDTNVYDISTFQPLSSSHDYKAQITEGNKLEFIFDNINLPNTAPASQGYVLFKIKTVDTLVLGDTFSNQAEIYFDLNSSILTNLETTTVAVPLSINEATTLVMSLYPNPTSDTVIITSNVVFDSYSLYDLKGVVIENKALEEATDQYQLNVSDLTSGIYILEVNCSEGKVIEKLIVK